MTLGDNIKKYRELRKLSVQELADKMSIGRDKSVGKANVYNWENNTNDPSLESLTDLAKALDCTVSELLGENLTHGQKNSDNTGIPLVSDAGNIYEELYQKFLGADSEYLVIHREVLKDHRLVAVEQFEKDKQQLDNNQRELESRMKQIEKLTDMIKIITERPINIQLPNPEKT